MKKTALSADIFLGFGARQQHSHRQRADAKADTGRGGMLGEQLGPANSRTADAANSNSPTVMPPRPEQTGGGGS